jgi:aminobenzoyl-glutamate utilization protein B
MDKKQFVVDSVARHAEQICTLNDQIWSFAELEFQVKQSADVLCEALTKEGFQVQRGLVGINHAFSASFGSGKPVIGILAEYDALSNLSQVAGCPTHNPLVPGGNGHGCGHCALGSGAFGAAVTIKEYLEKTGHSGTVVLYGCPAEENGWAKAFMARDGCFDGLDFALTWHPQMENFVVERSNLANISVHFSFKGIPAHAAGSPELGRSALDACELMNVGVNYLREHVPSDARIHYAYLDVGGISPNVVQDRARLHYFIRSPKSKQVLEIFERIKDVAKGAALMTGTQVEINVISGMSELIMNFTLDEVLYEAFQEVGAPVFDEKDNQLAAQFFAGLPKSTQEETRARLAEKMSAEEVERVLARPMATGIRPYRKPDTILVEMGSSDVGDVSYVTPTAQVSVACACLGTQLHSWNMTGQIATSLGHKGAQKASEVLALAAIKLLDRPEVIQKAKEEWQAATGGVYHCPVPKGVTPPTGDE